MEINHEQVEMPPVYPPMVSEDRQDSVAVSELQKFPVASRKEAKEKPLNRFYVYAYLREDLTPFYIGKGTGNRINQTHRHTYVKPPEDRSRRVFICKNMLHEDALSLEKLVIKCYGRKDLGTGILRNLTDGGEGASGLVIPQHLRDATSKLHKGRKRPPETGPKISKSKIGFKFTEESKAKMSAAQKGRKLSPERIKQMSDSNKGKTLSEEHKAKIGESNKGKVRSEESKAKWLYSMKERASKKVPKQKIPRGSAVRGNNYAGKPIKCLENNQNYPSLKNATDVLGLSYQTAFAYKKKNKKYRGYTFIDITKEEFIENK